MDGFRRFLSLLLVALLSLCAVPSWAAFTSLSTGGSASSTSSTNTLIINTGITFAVGEFYVALIAMDNLTTTDTNSNNVTSIVDTGGNTWTKAREWTNGNGTAATGATVAAFYCLVTVAMDSDGGDTITTNFSSAITSKAIKLWRFSVAAGSTFLVAGNATDVATDASTPPSMAISSLTSGEYLFLRAEAAESNSATEWTVSSSYTNIPVVKADTGTAGTSMEVRGEFRILTGTGSTSAPTLSGNVDRADIFLAIKETLAAAPANFFPRRIQRGGP